MIILGLRALFRHFKIARAIWVVLGLSHSVTIFAVSVLFLVILQCFDAVGWVTGRARGL